MGNFKRKRGKDVGLKSKKKRYKTEDEEIIILEKRIKDETPARGYAPALTDEIPFRSLALSENTLRGLEGDVYMNQSQKKKVKKSFEIMTAIQNTCIPHALAGRDILGAAKTGSGKTLAFLVPTLEQLYRARFNPQMGPGAIILSPTRELSMQIFAVLRSIGSYHNLSAGLLTGGKKEFRTEQTTVGQMNIIVATPGRLLQHLEQTPNFDVQEVRMLILDEADRILDMGFREQLQRILDYLPKHTPRQTMLFSATQTKNVKDLATLSFREKPEYLFVHGSHNDKDMDSNDKEVENTNISPTPSSLKEQNVMIVPLEHKMNMIFSFLKSHLNKKTIIFFSSCAQVRQVHAIFCALQPGLPIMALHGKIKQHKRTKIYFDFCERGNTKSKHSKKQSLQNPTNHKGAALFATDLAARGLDFPDVDWVLQADAPEDKDTYIHRVGRTARFHAGGRSLLLLLPSEQNGMMKVLTDANIPLKKINMNPNKAISISQKAASIVASNPNIKELSNKAFTSYLRSLYLMPNKDIFSLTDIDLDAYAISLGLASTPSTRFLKKIKGETREDYRTKKNVSKKLQRLKEQIKAEKLEKKIAKMNEMEAMKYKSKLEKKKTNDDKESDSDDDDDDDDDGLLVVKQKHEWDQNIPKVDIIEEEPKQKRVPKRISTSGSSSYENKKIIFDADGNERDVNVSMAKILEKNQEEKYNEINEHGLESANEEYMRTVKERLAKTKELDYKEEKERIREKRRRKKMQEKEYLMDEDANNEAEVTVTLGGGSDNDNPDDRSVHESSSSSSSESDSDDSDSDDNVDVSAQEELALSLIRNK